MNSGSSAVVADPFLAPLLRDSAVRFVPFPLYAVSSHESPVPAVRWVGERFNEAFGGFF